jgi:nucleoside 2-deoxyribosyltransferase
MSKVYLAGPISGLTYDDAEDWRNSVRTQLKHKGIDCYSPLRNKQHLRNIGIIEQSYASTPLSTDRGIMTRDHWDCQTADLIFVNLLGTTRVSIGTVMEIAWGFAYRKPIVLVMEKENNLHDHPMIREAVGFHTDNLNYGIDLTASILLPDNSATTTLQFYTGI